MKNKNIIILSCLALGILFFAGYSLQQTSKDQAPNQISVAEKSILPALEKTQNQSGDLTSESCTESFIKSLEKIDLDYVGGEKHWRKGDYGPMYKFLKCDIDKERARLLYVRELSTSQDDYYLDYFTKIDGIWKFDFSDVVFIPKIQNGGSKTTIEDVLKTRNEMYWLSLDKIKK